MRQMTPLEILVEAERLKEQASLLNAAQVKEVIERIHTAIRLFRLTPADLFPASARATVKHPKRKRKAIVPASEPVTASTAAAKKLVAATGRKLPPKFKDANGNVWSGRGTTPRWLAAEVAAGKSIQDFAV